MSKKVSLGAALAMVFIAAAAAAAVAMSLSVKMYNSIISDLPDREKLYSSVSEIDKIIRDSYYGAVDSDLLNSHLYEGYVKGLGDKDSVYLTSEEYSRYKNRAAGTINGIGVTAAWDTAGEYLTVVSVASGSPADKAGLKKGARIEKIDEQPVTRENYEQLTALFSGDKLTTVNITYGLQGKTSVINVVRGYESQAVIYDNLDGIGYIRIIDFYSNAVAQLKTALDEQLQAQVKSLVIDVRAASGGEVQFAARMADLFVPLASTGSGAMASAVNRAGETVELFSSDTAEVTVPVVILTDGATKGAAEFFVSALKAFGKAQTVGTVTAGKGTLQKLFELSDGGAVMLTVAVIVPYDQKKYNETGIQPDYEVAPAEGYEGTAGIPDVSGDRQLAKAVELLSKQ